MTIQDQLNTDLFKKVSQLLTKHNIPFWLDTKSLLVFVLNEIGIDMAADKNLRIGIPGEYFEKLVSLQKEISFGYRFQFKPDRSGRKWIDKEYCRIGILSRWTHKQKAFKIFITPKYLINNKYRWVDKRSCKQIDQVYYKSIKYKCIENKQIPIPDKSEEYLEIRFGAGWKNPNQTWIASIDDSTIVDDSELKEIEYKTVIRRSPFDKIQLQDGNYHKRMKGMLLKTIDILNEKKFKYWLEAGTLLGIIRDGDLIPWDYDADIGIPAESADDIMKLRLQFLPKYLIKRRYIRSAWIPGNMRVIKVKTPWEKIKQINFHVDLFCVYPVQDKYRWIDTAALKHVDRKYYDTLDTIEWEGRKIYIPNHVEEYLSLRYGNWEVPAQNYNAGLHDGAIAEKGF